MPPMPLLHNFCLPQMENFFIIDNSTKDPEGRFAAEVAAFLRAQGKACTLVGETSGAAVPEAADCALVLGGDGTVLQAAHAVMNRNLPLLGINLGTLGYLAQIEKKDWQSALRKVLAGAYSVEERMLLEGSVPDGGREYALNDVVFARKGALQILNLDVFVNGQFLNSFNADGIIVSTPTGSTAYNLSAGGPIVEPGAKMIVITPICPHTLSSRSVVLSSDDVVQIRIGSTSTAKVLEAEVHFDGRRSAILKTGDKVTIHRSGKTVRLVLLEQRSFLETLHRKMANIT